MHVGQVSYCRGTERFWLEWSVSWLPSIEIKGLKSDLEDYKYNMVSGL